jgi:lipopolysaccharide transport system ATP-binding protein
VFLGRGLDSEEFWALRGVSFTVDEGTIVGVVGKNGSGKSTLLKILSRIVAPTEGSAVVRGRTASLLEVGTGFHPELTGRENIFLNGAILGMPRREIQRKFDEIVEFAEVERFLDTPVKFYSSGMYVRLAFAIAAHIDPDILIVDEVLSVGDRAFQDKSLGKMRDVTQSQGRTVLFVSHNTGLLRTLCQRGLLLSAGHLIDSGDIDQVLDAYLLGGGPEGDDVPLENRSTDAPVFVRSLRVLVGGRTSHKVPFRQPFSIQLEIEATEEFSAVVGVAILDSGGTVLTTSHTQEIGAPETDRSRRSQIFERGVNERTLNVDENIFRPGRYVIEVSIFSRRLVETFDRLPRAATFEVTTAGGEVYFDERQPGLVFPAGTWWADRA